MLANVGYRPLQRRARARANGDNQGVILDPGFVARLRSLVGDVDGCQPTQVMRAAATFDELAQVVAGRPAKPERLDYGQGPVPELTIGGEKFERDPLFGKGTQGKRRFERSYARPSDEYTQPRYWLRRDVVRPAVRKSRRAIPGGISIDGNVRSKRQPTVRSKYKQSDEQRSAMPSVCCRWQSSSTVRKGFADSMRIAKRFCTSKHPA
jgi:hypothetical protein